MPSKNLLAGTKIEEVKQAHICQASQRHKLASGDIRLSIRNPRDGNWEKYCKACGLVILRRDQETLARISTDLKAGVIPPAE